MLLHELPVLFFLVLRSLLGLLGLNPLLMLSHAFRVLVFIDSACHHKFVKLNLDFAQESDFVVLVSLVHLFLVKQLGGNVEDCVVDGLDFVVFGAKLL